MELVASDLDRRAAPRDAPVADVVAGLEGFALEAERIAAREGGNTVLSPASMALAFAMVQAGARGDTADRIAAVFGFPGEAGVHEAMNALTATLGDANRRGDEGQGEVVIDLANAIWTQVGFDVERRYLDTLAAHYGAGVNLTDFRHDRAGSRDAINHWVAELTRHRITDLVPDGAITADTRLMVVNAVYLRAAWATPFVQGATRPAPFHRADGATVEVPTMRAPSLRTRYATGQGYTAVELPYAGWRLAMDVIVPDPGTSLDSFAGGLRAGDLGRLTAALVPGPVDLSLPRWDTRAGLDLGPLLTELGLPVPGGDLGGIAPGLEIGKAVHAADITVDEAGTEAAAATAVAIERAAAPTEPPRPVVVDRPFLFTVRHVDTGAVLFLGRVVDPS